jgi:hypothetical protein
VSRLTLDDIKSIQDPVTLDLSTLTLGESMEAERESGMTLSEILRSQSGRRILALMVYGSRSFDSRPSWSELASLKVLDVSSSTSRRSGDGVSKTSKG